MSFKVVITDCTMADAGIETEVLRAIGAEVLRYACKTPDEVVAAARDAHALMVQWAPITADVIRQLEHCQIVSRYGIGLDMIDLEAAREKGIRVVANTDYCIQEVAEHALAFVLACARKLPTATSAVRHGNWNKKAVLGSLSPLSRQTLGIVGLGRIGRRVAQMASPLVDRILAFDPFVSSTEGLPGNTELTTLDELVSHADFLTLHCPLSASTRHLFDAGRLRSMKRNAWLINVSRGGLIDEDALVDALRQGLIGGAALDVFTREPAPPDHPLLQFENVLATPHSAWYSDQAYRLLQENTARAVVDHFRQTSQCPE